ncbi:MAG: SAM-dependent chlorinase/fluorinase [Thermoleophilia bacterium]|nr:SAM-dependent chlorinase/fluorinase [Thermoleophilia bacterium]
MTRPVALLTDYGPGSEHVGALHAVIAAACPVADRIDLAHDIPPGDVRWGAVVLGRLAPLLPGAICVAVVDPGVGTDRAATAVELLDGGAVVGPDNGVLAELLPAAVGAVRLEVPPAASATFHGRDVFAPAAARLAAGAALAALGPRVELGDLVVPTWTSAAAVAGRITAAVIGRDRFGNAALDGGEEHLQIARLSRGDRVVVTAESARHPATVARTFADVPRGELLVHVDSAGLLALAVRDGDAVRELALEVGAAVEIAG